MSDEKKQDKSLIPNASLDRVRVYSGAQPSADSMHLGNYIGAVNNWVALQEDPANECLFFIPDMHAITVPQDPQSLRDRPRLTSDGMVRSCLFSTEETSLRDLLRGGGDDAQIAAQWADAMWAKPAAHGLNIDTFARASRTMSRIGG